MSRPLAIPLLSLTDGAQTGDCVITSLTIWLGMPYEKVLAAARTVCKSPETNGMYDPQTRATARRLGYKLRQTKKWDWAKSEGLLMLGGRKKRNGKIGSGHCVVLCRGLIFDGVDVWLPSDYFKENHRYIPRSLMVPA